MNFLLRELIKIIPIIAITLFLTLIQYLLIPINITGIFLYGQLYIHRQMYPVIVSVIIISLLFDTLKISPLATWSLCFFLCALPVLVALSLMKFLQSSADSIATRFIYTIAVGASSYLQQFMIYKLLGMQTFNSTIGYSILITSLLYVILDSILFRKKYSSLLS